MATPALTGRLQVLGAPGDRFETILTPAALEFLGQLDAAFARRRAELLAERRHRAELLAAGGALDFVPCTASVREDPSWRVAPPAPGLTDRRVEIAAPPERRTAAGALGSGARVWVADFEDATAPTWHNIIEGQLTLRDAVERTAGRGAPHGPGAGRVTIAVRPRGWHLTEKHLLVDGRPIAASLVDFGLYFFHCAQRQIDAGSGPYFCLSKLENHLEARLWNDIFVLAQDLLGIPRGTVRASVLIETVTAAFEMEEILYELREHAAGLTAGRWDYLFSVVKTFAHRPDLVLPDRSTITMTAPFLRACTELLVHTCHKRGAHAIGAMAAQIPGRERAAAEAALATVRLDKEREAEDGFDGSWVAHPGLVPVCRTAFDAVLGERPHQIERTRGDVSVAPADLLSLHRTATPPTEEGVRANIALALRYFDAWLRGRGAPALYGRIEDAAGAETARCQIWQWLRHGAVGRERVERLLDQESAALAGQDPGALCAEARALFARTALGPELPAFFTTDGYARHLVRREHGQ